jgi:DMSO/TMAO reductase YedYZ heme-binding membrane subunit
MSYLNLGRLLFKALRLLWPYLRSAIFKDRTVIEVIRENKHFTGMLGLILLLVWALAISTMRVSELKEQAARKVDPANVAVTCTSPFETSRLNDLLKE